MTEAIRIDFDLATGKTSGVEGASRFRKLYLRAKRLVQKRIAAHEGRPGMCRKIDYFLRVGVGKGRMWQYECSTNAYPTCVSAKRAFCKRHALSPDQVIARFKKDKAVT